MHNTIVQLQKKPLQMALRLLDLGYRESPIGPLVMYGKPLSLCGLRSLAEIPGNLESNVWSRIQPAAGERCYEQRHAEIIEQKQYRAAE